MCPSLWLCASILTLCGRFGIAALARSKEEWYRFVADSLGSIHSCKVPVISVLAYTGLAVLAGTLGFRVYKAIESQVKKTDGENPFQEYLAKDITLPQERIHAQVDVLAEHAIHLANQLKRLVFVESIVDSAKFALILWAMTYIGYWFSGFALVVLAVLAAFSVPKIYEMYKEPIDAQLNKISEQIKKLNAMAEDKCPFLKKVQAEVEKKEQ